jgi:hypothetical protein
MPPPTRSPFFRRSNLARLQSLLGVGRGTTGETAASKSVAAKVAKPEAAKQKVDVRRVQSLLTGLGYAPGPADGRMGPRTAAAIGEFQRREGLAVDGRLSARLLGAQQTRAAPPAKTDAASVPRARTTKAVGPTVRVKRIALTGNPVLPLPDAVQLARVHLGAGRLDATTAASASRGRLQGQVQLDVADLAFRAVTEADAERAAGTVGVPLQTAAGLLKDMDGRITLTLPVIGTS